MHTLRNSALLSLLLAACGPSSPKTGTTTSGATTHHSQDQGSGEQVADAASATKGFTPALQESALANDPMGVTIHRLSNGMTVYISTDRSTPSISSWIAVRAGSRHDPADSTGLAHYLEHMLFKGSSRLGTLDIAKEKAHLATIAKLYDDLRATVDPAERKRIFAEIDKETQATSQYSVPNEFDNLYASLGIGGVNAFTSDDQTVYIAEVPKNRFEQWAEVEGERFGDPQFRLFYPELESVYEEKNRSLDNPMSRIYQAISLGLYPQHPYGTQPTIGHGEHLKTPAYGDMVEYFDRWYRPNNMAIVLAGDIDAAEALPVLEKAFGGLEAKELPELPPSSVDAPKERKEVTITAPGEQSIFIAWPTVPAGHEDEVALEAMDMVMDNSATGLLNLELVLSQKLPRAGSFGDNMAEAGYWILTGTAREGQDLADVEKELMSVVAKLKAGDFTQADLDAIVTNVEIDEKKKLENNGARVSAMTSAYIEGRPWSEVVKSHEELRKVTREDVMRVANSYLTDAPVVVKRVRGDFKAEKVDKPSITPIKIDSAKKSPYATEVATRPVKALEPEWLEKGKHYQVNELPAGPFFTVKNERNDLFNLRYDLDLGERQEPLLCLAMDLFETSGAGTRTAAELQKELYAMGTTVSFSCGSQESSISLSGIDRNLEKSVALFNEWLATPKLQPGALDKLKQNTLSKRKDAMGEPSVIAAAAAEYALHGKDSDYLKVASNKAISAAKEDKLLGLVAGLKGLQHETSYYGPRDAAALSSVVAWGDKHKKVKAPSPTRYRKVNKPTLFFVDQKVAQAQVRMAFPAKSLKKDEHLQAQLFSQYVGGGMGALVFQEIREARGLAYSAWSYYQRGNRKADDTAVMAGLGTQADKTIEATSTMLDLIAPLEVTDSRFATAKASMEANYRKTRVPPRFRTSNVQSWADMGYDADPRPEWYAALPGAKASDMESFANSRTKVAPIIAITGDSSRIDLKALAKAAGIKSIKTLKVEQLFGY